ncbi:MAG: nitroreductase family protein [Desulfopila sp.]
MVTVHQDICSGCGRCAMVCPHRLLRMVDRRPVLGDGECMGCGHCQAVCPAGAVQVEGLSTALGLATMAERLAAIQPGEYDSERLVQLLRSRRSCRNYTRQEVALALLEDLVRIGTTAPSGTNSQLWSFYLLPRRPDVEELGGLTADFFRQLNRMAKNPLYRFLSRLVLMKELANYYRQYYPAVVQALRQWDEEGIDRLFHGATAAIVVTCRKTASCPAEDAMLASQNILLAAHAIGLGSCLIGYVVEAMRRSARMRRRLSIPAEEEIYSVIALGYPAVAYSRVGGRRPVRPQVVHLAR